MSDFILTKEVMDFLAWKNECIGFQGDFERTAINFFEKEKNYDKIMATICARDLWRIYSKSGLVQAYQEYITDEDAKECLIFIINN